MSGLDRDWQWNGFRLCVGRGRSGVSIYVLFMYVSAGLGGWIKW